MEAYSPRSLEEAIGYLTDRPGLRPVAGCTDLMVASPEDLGSLPGVLNLFGIQELRGIRWRDEVLEIGATTTFSEIARSPEVRERFPALARAAAQIGGWQIQNRATVGGNMANASPAGDSLPVLLVLDAEVVLAGAAGERTLPYRRFHLAYRQTALAPGELIASIRLPEPGVGTIQAFRKIGTREAHAISKVVVALLARVADGRILEYRLAAGSVAPIPVRLSSVEDAIRGRPADRDTADLAGRLAAESVEPIDDVRSTAAYRRFVLERVVRRLTLLLGERQAAVAG